MDQTAAHRPAARALNPTTRALLGRLWREHLGTERRTIGVVLALTVFLAGATALYPLVIDWAFRLFAARDDRIVWQLPPIVIAVTGIKAAAQYWRDVTLQTLVLRTIAALQGRMFAHLVQADLARLEREPPATLATRFTTDAALIREAMTKATNAIADALTVVGLVASMLWLDWVMTLVAAALYPLAAVPIVRIGKRIRRASGTMQEATGEAAALLHESFSQARTVKTYRLEAAETARAKNAFARLTEALVRMTKGRARVDPVLEVLGGAAIAAVIAFAGWRAAGGTSDVGAFTGFVAALLIAGRPVRALGSFNVAVQEGMAGLVRTFAVIDEPPGVVDRPHAGPLPPGPGRVEFRDVHFAYPGGRAGVSGLSLLAEAGRTVALVGASGGGKSTALALVPRLHDAQAGAVLIDGHDVRALTLQSLRGAIAYVGQDALLFDATVADNVRMGRPEADDAAVAAALRDAAAWEFVTALPEGMETRVGTGGGRLSGGQRQRVALARALLKDPRILLLDEATSALDTESEAAVQAALARLRQDRTTLVIAHRLSTVRNADRIVVLEGGRAVEQGTHEDLLAAGGAYARLVAAQALG